MVKEITYGIDFTLKQWGNIQAALIFKAKFAKEHGLKTYCENEDRLVARIGQELEKQGAKPKKEVEPTKAPIQSAEEAVAETIAETQAKYESK